MRWPLLIERAFRVSLNTCPETETGVQNSQPLIHERKFQFVGVFLKQAYENNLCLHDEVPHHVTAQRSYLRQCDFRICTVVGLGRDEGWPQRSGSQHCVLS